MTVINQKKELIEHDKGQIVMVRRKGKIITEKTELVRCSKNFISLY